MWNSQRLEQVAKVIRPLMSARCYAELNYALDSYGVDHGKSLLALFATYFTDDFMRQFYDGRNPDFLAAWDKLQEEISINPPYKFTMS